MACNEKIISCVFLICIIYAHRITKLRFKPQSLLKQTVNCPVLNTLFFEVVYV